MNMHLTVMRFLGVALLSCSLACQAKPAAIKKVNSPVVDREKKEEKMLPNYFSITLYKPTYLLPYYYTGSPDYAVYQNSIPSSASIRNAESKYQFSFKVPVWKDIFKYHSSLFLAYTQLSYWQVYQHDRFFRESDYEPELFFANEVKWPLIGSWSINFLNPGLDHQSNGYGGTLERSWNRFYLEAISSTDHWMINLKPWYVISTHNNNSNIAKYLGYGRVLVAYKWHQQLFSLQTYNLIESGTKRSTVELTWSFPITPYIKGYVQVFSGYGQSLIEYNHRTNSAGIGFTLNDWI